MQKELILEKECDLKPGFYNVVKVDGKKVTVEEIEGKLAEKHNPFWGVCANKREALHKVVEDAMKDRENKPFRTPRHV